MTVPGLLYLMWQQILHFQWQLMSGQDGGNQAGCSTVGMDVSCSSQPKEHFLHDECVDNKEWITLWEALRQDLSGNGF